MPQPATAQELRQQWLTVRGHHPGDLESEHLDRTLELRADRRRGRFTRFTGHAGPAALPEDFLNRPVSPTALEEWVNNPFGYFVTKVLGAELFADNARRLLDGEAVNHDGRRIRVTPKCATPSSSCALRRLHHPRRESRANLRTRTLMTIPRTRSRLVIA